MQLSLKYYCYYDYFYYFYDDDDDYIITIISLLFIINANMIIIIIILLLFSSQRTRPDVLYVCPNLRHSGRISILAENILTAKTNVIQIRHHRQCALLHELRASHDEEHDSKQPRALWPAAWGRLA